MDRQQNTSVHVILLEERRAQVDWIIGDSPYDCPPEPNVALDYDDDNQVESCGIDWDDFAYWSDDGIITIAMGGFPPRRFENRDRAIAWLLAALTGTVDPQAERPIHQAA